MNRLRRTLGRWGIKRGDLIVLAALLAFSAVLGIAFIVCRPEPEYVSVKADGMEIARLPLDEDCVFRVGDGNTIEICGGSVRMMEADCPDKICVKTGSISRSGQSIVCAPHKVVVTVIGKNDNRNYDVITN